LPGSNVRLFFGDIFSATPFRHDLDTIFDSTSLAG
jgi:hypothetical protein